MTRFYSKYEIEKKEKQLKEDVLLNASNYRTQLKEALNVENHRVNVDSAKKKAVLQGMDYNGFHQMVLGANLKGTKTSELLELKPKAPIMNNVMTQNLLGKEVDALAGNFVISHSEDSGMTIEGLKIIEKLKNDKVIEENIDRKEEYKSFRKAMKTAPKVEDKIEILKKTENFEDLINCETLESDTFLDIINTVGSFISVYYSELKDSNESIELLKFLDALIKHQQFSNLKKFIGKKHKTIFHSLNEIREQIFTTEEEINFFTSIFINITK